ncbi:MAG TPA: RAMP superfamily CRISPR-associated protein [Streptosporangiaceae bacterium]|nr:RAMP superfamily CRISPR-associated protein [Streptosporangiaceae bacterium]
MTQPWHDLTLRTVTPAFLGRFGTPDDQTAIVPFPVPSLRGVLAYWLRSLAGAHLGNIDHLHAVESAVFGSARTEQSGGPSPVLLRGGRVPLSALAADSQPDGFRYLMGPGLLAKKDKDGKKVPSPRFLKPGTLELRVRVTGSPASTDLFLAALWGLRAFGGIGARSRRGFGTIAIDQVPDLGTSHFNLEWLQRDGVADLVSVLNSVAAAIDEIDLGIERKKVKSAELPSYPCFAERYYRHSRDDEDELLRGGRDGWRAALDNAGTWLREFRHGGDRRTAVPQPTVGAHSRTYTDVVQSFLNSSAPGRWTQDGPATAAALGLPIPYSDHQGRRDERGKPTQRVAMINAYVKGQKARRASPLWLRVRHDGSAWRLRSLAFYSEWLPPSPDAGLTVTWRRHSASVDLLTEAQVRAELERWF